MDVQIIRIQIIAIIGSAALLGFIVELLRKKQLREEYALLWLFGGLAFLALSVWRDLLTTISFAIGVAYPPAALFLALIMGCYAMLLHFSLVFSRLADRNRLLAQEVALLRLDVERLRGAESPRDAKSLTDEATPTP